ncbi:hypothetical protein AB1046_22755 [Promicromonospora sp. Populi]|uniref:hypothetical protein n=1 Tax=Promicromonospora sp. Populi TaxID=3239420 RepID=UPI0034E1A332
MSGHVFVDETKARDYLLVAVAIDSADLKAARSTIRSLTMPGQARLHMHRESDSRRRKILAAIAKLPVEATIFRAGGADRPRRKEADRRKSCLEELVAGALRDAQTSICIEHDDSMIQMDRSVLVAVTKAHHAENTLRYRHDRAASEPLLALPDAVAWAWARGGEWRPRCDELVTKVIDT